MDDTMDKVTPPTDTVATRQFQELTIYFFGASLVGHFLELVWIAVRHYPITVSFVMQAFSFVPLPLAEPYGFGVVALLLFVVPFLKKYKPHPVVIFMISTFLMGLVEYICAAVLVVAFGHNYFWDYSNMAFNIQGYVCLETSVLFGIVATLFLYVVYPWAKRYLNKVSFRKLQLITIILVTLYALHFLRLALLYA